MMRPQLGSCPLMAVFTSGELATLRAATVASRREAAPRTLIVTSLVAPSPSSDQHARQPVHQGFQPPRELAEPSAASLEGGVLGQSVGQYGDGVTRRLITIHADAVERSVNRPPRDAGQGVARNHGIGGDETEHGGQVWLDHPHPLGHATERDGPPADLHPERRLLGPRVSGHDGLGGRTTPLGGEGFDQLRERSTDSIHRKRNADDPGGRDQDVLGRDPQEVRHRFGHLARVADPLLARADVGTPAGGNDGLGHATAGVLHRHEDGRPLDLVRREDRGDPRWCWGVHQGQIFLAARFDTPRHRPRQNPGDGRHSAVEPLQFGHLPSARSWTQHGGG